MIASLTFDDGYVKHYRIAEALYRLDIQASFYIITGLSKYRGVDTLVKEPKLLKKIYDMGHEIGSHTHTHRNLASLDDTLVEFECRTSAKTIEEIPEKRPVG